MSGRWLAKVDMRLANGSALPLPRIGTWVTNRIGFCTAAALATAEAVSRATGTAACAVTAVTAVAAFASASGSSCDTCTPQAASHEDAASARPIRTAFRWGEGNRLLMKVCRRTGEAESVRRWSARRQVPPAGRGRSGAAITFGSPWAKILGFYSLTVG